MKKTILTSVASAAMLLPLATACSEEGAFVGEDTGRITLEVDFKSDPVSAKAGSRAAVENPITADDLSLRLTALEAEFSKTWTSISEFDPAAEFSVGTYKLEAFYGDPAEEGYGKPHYNGEQEVKVVTGKNTPVSLTVTLANSIVKVVYTDAFKEYMTAYSATVRTSLGGEIAYDEADTRELFVAPGTVSLALDITKPNGKQGQVVAASFEAKPRYRHTVTVDYNGGETGKLEGLTITCDDSMNDIVEHTIDISDDILSASAPTLTPDGFASGETVSLVETTAAPKDLKVNIVARGKIGSVTLTTASAALVRKGWPETVDLANCDQATQAKLNELGLNVLGLWKNPDEMAVIDFTDVLPNIPFEEGAGNTSVFTLSITDRYSKTCDPVSFSVDVLKLEMELLQGSILADGRLNLLMKYNGGDVENVKFKAKNSRGTYTELIVNKISGTAPNYEIDLTHPANDAVIKAENTLEVMAVKGDLTSEIAAKSPAMIADKAATNAFAKRAFLGVKFTDDAVMAQSANVEWYLSTDNGTTYNKATSTARKPAGRAVVGSKTYELTGLQPATTYMAYAKLGEEQTFPIEFTTEAAAQVPDSGFETWTSEQKGDYQYLWKVSSGTPWATVNELTIASYGSGSGIGTKTGGCAYKATSGTIPANGRSNYSNYYGGPIGTTKKADGHTTGNATLHSDLGHNGNAALIRTVGYGSGNSAGLGTGNPASGFNVCKNVASGELYLGTYDNGPKYSGYDFSSRPSTLNFYYKYIPYGSSGDYGNCQITLMDKDGNIISSNSADITEQSSYTLMSLPLTYSPDAPKCAKIMIAFKSSANPDLTNSKTWLYGPGNKNVSGGEYVGSELYIDDIELIY